MQGKENGGYRQKRGMCAELNEGTLSQFHGTHSLPLQARDNRKIAAKIVDGRGIELLKIMPLE